MFRRRRRHDGNLDGETRALLTCVIGMLELCVRKLRQIAGGKSEG